MLGVRSVDKDGNEGACAANTPPFRLVPLIACDEARLKTLRPMAKKIAGVTGKDHQADPPVDANGQHMAIPSTAETKDEFAIIVRAFFELMNVVRYCVAMEVWVVERRGSIANRAAVDALLRTGISNEPDRIEVIALQAEDVNEGILFAERRIIRHSNKKPTLDTLFVHPSDCQASGRFVRMLPQRGTRQ
jgi:hypothetical protein